VVKKCGAMTSSGLHLSTSPHDDCVHSNESGTDGNVIYDLHGWKL
jgi:hypothetical protein